MLQSLIPSDRLLASNRPPKHRNEMPQVLATNMPSENLVHDSHFSKKQQ